MSEVPNLGAFGEVDEDQLSSLDDPPVEFTLVGYNRLKNDDGTRTKREFVFHAVPTFQFFPWLSAVSKADKNGNVGDAQAAAFLFDCLVPDERQRWDATIRDTEVHFEAAILGSLTRALIDYYRTGKTSARPTKRPSASAGGPRRTGRTSTAKATGKAATSRKAS